MLLPFPWWENRQGKQIDQYLNAKQTANYESHNSERTAHDQGVTAGDKADLRTNKPSISKRV